MSQLPTMYTVTSDMIESVGFSINERRPGYGSLFVRMKNHSVYEYQPVPEILFHELLTSSSKGQYFLNEIRDKYETTKVAES